MNVISDIRKEFVDKYKSGHVVNGTVELIGSSFIADQDYIFGRPNFDYINREIAWYESMSLNIYDIPGRTPRIWQDVASSKNQINSNYGYLMYSRGNGSQFYNVVETLATDPGGRRATAIYTRPSMHSDWNQDGMSDFICTNAVQYLIRDGKLNVVVQMRSNDAVFGFRNDLAWQKFMQNKIIGALADQAMHVEPGDIIWNAASLHIYERHFWLLDHYRDTGIANVDLK